MQLSRFWRWEALLLIVEYLESVNRVCLLGESVQEARAHDRPAKVQPLQQHLPECTCNHTGRHIHNHTQTHTHTYPHTYSHTYSHIHAIVQTPPQINSLPNENSRINSSDCRQFINASMRAPTTSGLHVGTHTLTNPKPTIDRCLRPGPRTRTRTHTHTHTRTHTRTHMHTHTHAHTHTQAPHAPTGAIRRSTDVAAAAMLPWL
eukprot:GHVU01192929.1.p1 GENE.GHVU01192929.1~~GHVU01192929.1.p1  ORF type:complete len:204 (-),score=8.16 GHVU01192929.1:317-928(-)